MTMYTTTMPWGEELRISANLVEAGTSISYYTDDGERVSTPFQTADAGHRPHAAMMLIIGYLGAEWYQDDNDHRDDHNEVLSDLSDEIEVSACCDECAHALPDDQVCDTCDDCATTEGQ